MRIREYSGLWIVLVAALGVYYVPSKSGSPGTVADKAGSKPAMGEEKPGGDSSSWELDPLRPLWEFWRTGAESQNRPQLPVGYDLEYIVATVPDPIDSAFAYRFDDMIDAMQRAVETQGYVLDRWQYPWVVWKELQQKAQSSEKANEGATAPANLTNPTNKTSQARFYQEQPGVLLFRHTKTQKLLVLFLVGETPTSGIHKVAFKKSLNLIAQYGGIHASEEIRVLGPCFSGSQTSLEIAIKEWSESRQALMACSLVTQASRMPILSASAIANALSEQSQGRELSSKDGLSARSLWHLGFQIVSGGATSIQVPKLKAGCRPADVTFHATLLPDGVITNSLLQYLKLDETTVRKKAAWLTESNTTFGLMAVADVVAAYKVDSDKYRWEDSPILTLPFPLHVSEMRAALHKGSRPEEQYLPRLLGSSSKLRLPLPDPGGSPDIEETMDQSMAAVTAELTLSKILSTISREEKRYVGLNATDSRDKIFLASLIHDYCPDVQLFTTHADLLLAHPDFSYCLKGTIVASTYPLYSKSQLWSFPYKGDKARLLLESQCDQGYYNAMLALLGDSEHMIDYGPPFTKLSDVKRNATMPVVWISVIGQQGIYPLTVIDPLVRSEADEDRKLAEAYVFPADAKEHPEEDGRDNPSYTGFWLSIFLAISIICLALSWAYSMALSSHHRQRHLPLPASREAAPLRGFFTPRRAGFQAGQQFFLCAGFFCLTVVYGYLAWPCSLPLLVASEEGTLDTLEPLLWLSTVCVPRLAFLTWLWLLVLWVTTLLTWLRILWKRLANTQATVPPKVTAPPSPAPAAADAELAPQPLRWKWRAAIGIASVLMLLLVASPLFDMVIRALLQPSATSFLFFERVVNLQSGVSPMAPVLFLAIGFCCWTFCELKRLLLLDRFQVDSPFPAKEEASAVGGVQDAQKRIMEVLRNCPEDERVPAERPANWSARIATFLEQLCSLVVRGVRTILLVPPAIHVVVWAAVAFTLMRLLHRFLPTLEGETFDRVIMIGFALVSFCVLYKFMQFLLLWRRVKRLLHEISRLPMLKAYARLPAKVSSVFGSYLYPPRHRSSHLEIPRHLLGLLRSQYGKVRLRLTQVLGRSSEALKSLDGAMKFDAASVFEVEAKDNASTKAVQEAVTENELTHASGTCLVVLSHFWSSLAVQDAYGESISKESKPDEKEATENGYPVEDPRVDDKFRRWLQVAEDLVAVEVVSYVSQFFVHLRNVVTFLTLGPLVMLLAITSYPFQPQRLLIMYMWLIILSVVAGVIVVLVQMNRDEFVSRISRTTPNAFSLDRPFVASLVKYVAPLVAVVVAQFSDVSDLIYLYVEPIIRVLK